VGSGEGKEWKYYEIGPRKGELLICIPGACETATAFYKIMLILAGRGYRVVSVREGN
jgi:hypothetical protein